MSGGPIAAIVGVAESDLGVTGMTALQLQTQAVSRALTDAGIGFGEVDGLLTNGVSRFSTIQVAEYIGLRPVFTDSTMVGGSSYEVLVARAAEAVRSGLCSVAVVGYGSNQRSAHSRRLGGVIDAGTPQAQFEEPYGALNPLTLYAMAAQRHMHDFGTTPAQLAAVAVAARSWALLNPVAYRHGAGHLSVDDVLATPLVSSPLRAADCCLITDGGGAVVITSVERARSLPKAAVHLIGHGEATTNQSMSQIPDLTLTGAADSSARALGMAGVAIDDCDVIQVYDSFTITVLLTLEALGVCPRGASGSFVEGGSLAPGGVRPINTSGGGLSYCHPGMFGILLVIEAVRQLRGECGARQLPTAHMALCHGTGGILSHHATLVLTRG